MLAKIRIFFPKGVPAEMKSSSSFPFIILCLFVFMGSENPSCNFFELVANVRYHFTQFIPTGGNFDLGVPIGRVYCYCGGLSK